MEKNKIKWIVHLQIKTIKIYIWVYEKLKYIKMIWMNNPQTKENK